jgi:hypothetical protein
MKAKYRQRKGKWENTFTNFLTIFDESTLILASSFDQHSLPAYEELSEIGNTWQ